MARRDHQKLRSLPDWDLWVEVTRSVSPLPRRSPLETLGETAPPPPPPRRRSAPRPPILPAYQPEQNAGPRIPPGQVIEPNMRRKLMRGHIEIDATIDLHGMRQNEARSALNRFVSARFGRGDRTILVITGKGLKKTDPSGTRIVERGVLRAMLPGWLGEPSLAPMIAGWSAAAQSHGGEGAFYVRLRRAER